MEVTEDPLFDEEANQRRNRDSKRREARGKFLEEKEAEEFRQLGTAAALRKLEEDERRKEEARQQELPLRPDKEKTPKDLFVEEELSQVKQALQDRGLMSCAVDLVQVVVNVTKHRNLTLKLRFPAEYPEEPLNIDVTSRTLSPELILKLKCAADKEAVKHLHDQQVVHVVTMVHHFVEVNVLAPAYDDLKQIQEFFQATNCCIKSSREKTGNVNIYLTEGAYFLDLKCTIPSTYPEKPVEILLKEGNLPNSLQNTILIQAQEKARRLAEPPKVAQVMHGVSGRQGAGTGGGCKSEKLDQKQSLASRKMAGNLQASSDAAHKKAAELQKQMEENHVARPSLFPTIKYLFQDCLYSLARDMCSLCNKRLIPGDPRKVSKIPSSMMTFRLYCGHMYHHKCLEEYLAVPPFGKPCKVCGERIQHAKLVTDPRVLEQRWMHKQAREREIADVGDFMAF